MPERPENFLSRLRPRRVYLIFGVFFGILFLVLTPPFQVPDEPAHFYRAWQVSEGGFLSEKKDRRVGGELPHSLSLVANPFFRHMWAKDYRLSAEDYRTLAGVEINEKVRMFYDFNNTALYSPVCYIPQATGILIGRAMNLPVLYIFYLGRLFALAAMLFLVSLAVRVIPTGKWLLAAMAMLPGAVFINMSMSADVVTNSLAFLFIAYVLRFSLVGSVVKGRDVFLLLLLVVLLGSVKSAYAPLLFLLLMLRRNNFISTKHYFLGTSVLFFTGLITVLFWSKLLGQFYISYDEYDAAHVSKAALVQGTGMQQQLNLLLSDKLFVFPLLFKSLVASVPSHFGPFIGTFGWMDAALPDWLAYLIYGGVFILAFTDGHPEYRLSLKQKTMAFVIFILLLFSLIMVVYLTWLPVGYHIVGRFQGRYLIPFYPLFFLLFQSGRSAGGIIKIFAMALSGGSLSYSLYILLGRYWL